MMPSQTAVNTQQALLNDIVERLRGIDLQIPAIPINFFIDTQQHPCPV